MGPIDCPETSIRNYQSALCNNPEEWRSHLNGGRSLKSNFNNYFLVTRPRVEQGTSRIQLGGVTAWAKVTGTWQCKLKSWKRSRFGNATRTRFLPPSDLVWRCDELQQLLSLSEGASAYLPVLWPHSSSLAPYTWTLYFSSGVGLLPDPGCWHKNLDAPYITAGHLNKKREWNLVRRGCAVPHWVSSSSVLCKKNIFLCFLL